MASMDINKFLGYGSRKLFNFIVICFRFGFFFFFFCLFVFFFFFYEERKGIMYRMVDKKIAVEEI